MAIIVPTILTNDKNLYYKQFALYSSFTKRVQVDICDGLFGPTQTLDVSNAWTQEGWAALDLHMMVMNPSATLPVILKIKPSLVIFHAETSENLLPVFNSLKNANIKTGVAILKQTYPGKIASYIEAADHCLVFAGKLSAQGGEADLLQVEKVPIIRSINPHIEIAWDGGANMKNVRALAHSDIDVINVGSAIATSPDPKAAYDELVAEIDKQGVVI
ncbi:hypothetical protein IJH27_00010 [Candidatus Saccharibacteria bacterium]|nr:hypothetical protein [Candidatus Saccharibacteria bacterium]